MKYIFRPLLIFFFFHLMSCNNQQEQVELDAESLENNIAKDVEIIYSDSANVSLIITGPKMVNKTDSYNNNSTEFPEGIKITFFNKVGEVEGTLTADKGIQAEMERKIYFYGNVELNGRKNENLYTEELIWDQVKNKIFSKRLVKIVSPTDTLEGIGIEASQDLSTWFMVAPFGPMNVKN